MKGTHKRPLGSPWLLLKGKWFAFQCSNIMIPLTKRKKIEKIYKTYIGHKGSNLVWREVACNRNSPGPGIRNLGGSSSISLTRSTTLGLLQNKSWTPSAPSVQCRELLKLTFYFPNRVVSIKGEQDVILLISYNYKQLWRHSQFI